MTAAVLEHELDLPLLTIRLDALLSKYLGETASKLRVLFDSAASQRAVHLFDEFDALGGDRAGNDVGEARRILNSFLVFLESAGPQSIVVAPTNHKNILDRALLRRFNLVLELLVAIVGESRRGPEGPARPVRDRSRLEAHSDGVGRNEPCRTGEGGRDGSEAFPPIRGGASRYRYVG